MASKLGADVVRGLEDVRARVVEAAAVLRGIGFVGLAESLEVGAGVLAALVPSAETRAAVVSVRDERASAGGA